MIELVIYRGLPASGKSSLARRWVAADPQHRARVNRDDLRGMIHGGYIDSDVEQAVVAVARDSLIAELLQRGISVACDDTNLAQSVALRLAEVGWRNGAHVRVSDLTDVPLALCVARDFDRGYPDFAAESGFVGEDVIRGMHEKFLADGQPLEPLVRAAPDG